MVKAHECGTSKECSKCGISKEITKFEINKGRNGQEYRRNVCKRCRQDEANFRYRTIKEVRERKKQAAYSWRERNIEQVRLTHRKQHYRYYPKNKAKYLAKFRKRQEHIKKATPSWVNHRKIARIYELAEWGSRFTTERLEVDHIIPLQGETICGMHVETNMQILPRSENRSKWNKFDEDIVRYPMETPGL